MVQRITNTVEKASKDVTPVQLILNNSISLSKQILMSKMRPTGQIDLSGRMDEWISRQNALIKVAREKQSKTDHQDGSAKLNTGQCNESPDTKRMHVVRTENTLRYFPRNF